MVLGKANQSASFQFVYGIESCLILKTKRNLSNGWRLKPAQLKIKTIIKSIFRKLSTPPAFTLLWVHSCLFGLSNNVFPMVRFSWVQNWWSRWPFWFRVPYPNLPQACDKACLLVLTQSVSQVLPTTALKSPAKTTTLLSIFAFLTNKLSSIDGAITHICTRSVA